MSKVQNEIESKLLELYRQLEAIEYEIMELEFDLDNDLDPDDEDYYDDDDDDYYDDESEYDFYDPDCPYLEDEDDEGMYY